MPEFQRYLDSIDRHYDKWWKLYTLTDTIIFRIFQRFGGIYGLLIRSGEILSFSKSFCYVTLTNKSVPFGS